MAAATSYANSHGASLAKLIRSAGWTSARTLTQFYEKLIEEERQFQSYLMQAVPYRGLFWASRYV